MCCRPRQNSPYTTTVSTVKEFLMKTICLPILAALALSACNNKNPASCSSEETGSMIGKIVRENVEKQVYAALENNAELRGTDAMKDLNIDKIRNMAASIKIKLNDVRTMEKTSGGNTMQCRATMQLDIPDDIISRATATNNLLNNKNSVDFFELDYRREAPYYSREIGYNIQMTDDNKTFIVSLNNTNTVIEPIKALVTFALLKDPLNNALKEARAREEAEREQERIENEQAAIEAESKLAAELEEAKAKQKAALAEINAYWNAMPKSVQDKLQAEQTAWNSRQKAECEQRGKDVSDNETEQKIEQVNCSIEQVNARLSELKTIQSAMSEDLIKDAKKKAKKAYDRLVLAEEAIPEDIAAQLNFKRAVFEKQAMSQCERQNNDPQSQLAEISCLTKAFEEKAKELEGYSIK